MIQACQDFNSVPVLHAGCTDMARWMAPPSTEDKHIVLRRPHTVLLMATIAGMICALCLGSQGPRTLQLKLQKK